MLNKNTVWLCQYDDARYTNVYGILAHFPQLIDAKRFYFLNVKKNQKIATESEKKEFQQELDKSLFIQKAWFAGQYIEDRNMPTKAYLKPYEKLPKDDEVAFQITDGYLVVNQTCHEVMSQFNLGKTHFSKIEILDMTSDKKIIDKAYYFINIAETREFLDSKNSKGIDGSPYAPNDELKYIERPNDNDIKLENLASDIKIDMWHDPRLYRSLFLSDRLVQALFDAGIKQAKLGLVRCEINPPLS